MCGGGLGENTEGGQLKMRQRKRTRDDGAAEIGCSRGKSSDPSAGDEYDERGLCGGGTRNGRCKGRTSWGRADRADGERASERAARKSAAIDGRGAGGERPNLVLPAAPGAAVSGRAQGASRHACRQRQWPQHRGAGGSRDTGGECSGRGARCGYKVGAVMSLIHSLATATRHTTHTQYTHTTHTM